jgi:hypothetical protein
MVMVLGPTKNAGVKRDAEDENAQRDEETVQSDGDGHDHAPPAPPDDPAGALGEEQPGGAEASAGGRAGRA